MTDGNVWEHPLLLLAEEEDIRSSTNYMNAFEWAARQILEDEDQETNNFYEVFYELFNEVKELFFHYNFYDEKYSKEDPAWSEFTEGELVEAFHEYLATYDTLLVT